MRKQRLSKVEQRNWRTPPPSQHYRAKAIESLGQTGDTSRGSNMPSRRHRKSLRRKANADSDGPVDHLCSTSRAAQCPLVCFQTRLNRARGDELIMKLATRPRPALAELCPVKVQLHGPRQILRLGCAPTAPTTSSQY